MEELSDFYLSNENLPRRTDTIGLLAWQLIGNETTPPDFTAVIPLLDALHDEDRETEYRLRVAMFKLAMRLPRGEDVRPSHTRNALRHLRPDLANSLPHLLFNLGAVVGVLEKAVAFASQTEAPPEETKAEMTLVWADVGRARLGSRVTLNDGRTGIVVNPRRADGRCGIVIDDEGEQPAFGDEPQSYAQDPETAGW